MSRALILETPRLRVTGWLPADLPEFHALHADPRTMRFFTSGPYDLQRASVRLEESAGGCTVGRAGYGLAGDGHSREPGDLLACAHVENLASRRVLEKVGFVFQREGDWHGKPHAFYRHPAPSPPAPNGVNP